MTKKFGSKNKIKNNEKKKKIVNIRKLLVDIIYTLWHEVEIIMKFTRIEQRKQKKKRKKNSTKRGPRRSNNRLSRKK